LSVGIELEGSKRIGLNATFLPELERK